MKLVIKLELLRTTTLLMLTCISTAHNIINYFRTPLCVRGPPCESRMCCYGWNVCFKRVYRYCCITAAASGNNRRRASSTATQHIQCSRDASWLCTI